MTSAVGVSADRAASALAATWEHLIGAFPAGWTQREQGVVAAVTGVGLPNVNGVWTERLDLDDGVVADALDRVAGTGMPHCLQLRAGTPPSLSKLAQARGMVRQEPEPLMVLVDPAPLDAAQRAGHLRIRQLAPAHASVHAATAARGFETSEELFLELTTPAVLELAGVRCYVGELDGRAVTTGMGVVVGDAVAIFSIATDPDHRGRGFGAAVTARAVADGLNDGAAWSYLHSSPSGFGVYQRLGFRTVEHWSCWVATDGFPALDP